MLRETVTWAPPVGVLFSQGETNQQWWLVNQTCITSCQQASVGVVKVLISLLTAFIICVKSCGLWFTTAAVPLTIIPFLMLISLIYNIHTPKVISTQNKILLYNNNNAENELLLRVLHCINNCFLMQGITFLYACTVQTFTSACRFEVYRHHLECKFSDTVQMLRRQCLLFLSQFVYSQYSCS